MISERTTLFQLKKSLVNNGRRLCLITDYLANGEDACREICITRLADKSVYRVWHYDFLEKFVDVREKYFHYENFEFGTFEQAIEFLEDKLGIPLSELS